MNKNLKKVISAVAALAMTASTFVAFAANYPDVDASASYKKAVDELSSLNIINGYEDGTFQPDKLVNRAEFAKMAVTAMGKTVIAQAEAAANQNTEFTDVKADHWAAGYVSAATTNKLINGMGDGTFAPDANITYAQAMKMLVCAAGYEQWSVDNGGWPTGYMFYGNQLDIGNGVKDVVQDTEITRAQCAQMIDNVLNAPVCVETGRTNFDMYGNKYKELAAKDGNGEDFQSILTKNHKAYKVKGIVTDTNKSTGGSVKSDEVRFTIQSARNWLDQEDQISKSKGNAEDVTLLVGNSDIDKYLKQYVEVIIQKTEDDEYVALSAVLAGQNKEVTLEAADFDYENSNYNSGDYTGAGRLYFYSNGKTTNYKIEDNVALYVNGVEFDGDVNTGIDLYVKDNETSKVTLIDTPAENNNSTNGLYDLILVDVYATMIVDSVDDVDTDEPTINLMDDDAEIGSWELNLDETDDKSYTFVKDGEEITVADLDQYDVLSVKYDVNGKFEDSVFYEVVVSSKQEVGKATTYNAEDKEYEINGTKYKYNSAILDEDPLDRSTTYTLYLDAFGRIAYCEVDTVSKKIAIIDSAYEVNGGEAVEARIIFPDGSKEKYTLKDNDANIALAKKIVYVNKEDGEKNPIQNRVIDYSINTSTNELTVKKAYVAKEIGDDATGEYRANTSKLGTAKVSLETTAFIDASELTSIKAMDASSIVDGREYRAYAFEPSKTDKVCSLVIVTNGAGQISATTSVAVYNKTLSTENESGDAVDAYEVFVNGAKKTVNWESGLEAEELTQGDVILYETNGSGEIIDIKVLSTLDMTDTASVWDAALTNSASVIADAKTYVKGLSTKKYEADLQFGAIVGKSDVSVSIAEAVDGVTNEDEAIDITYADGCNFYVVDLGEKSDRRVSSATKSSVVVAKPANSAKDKDNDSIVDWTQSKTLPRLAIVKTVERDATDVVIIIPKKD